MTELESEPRQPPLKKVRLNRPFLDQDYYDLAVASPEYAPISEILSDSESEEQDIMGKKSSRQITRDHPRFEETQAKTKEPEVYKSRGYQFEMLEESMQRNIIIAVGGYPPSFAHDGHSNHRDFLGFFELLRYVVHL